MGLLELLFPNKSPAEDLLPPKGSGGNDPADSVAAISKAASTRKKKPWLLDLLFPRRGRGPAEDILTPTGSIGSEQDEPPASAKEAYKLPADVLDLNPDQGPANPNLDSAGPPPDSSAEWTGDSAGGPYRETRVTTTPAGAAVAMGTSSQGAPPPGSPEPIAHDPNAGLAGPATGAEAAEGARGGAMSTSEPAGAKTPDTDSEGLDTPLRELFTEDSSLDPQLEILLARIERVDARELANELRALVRTIGADSGHDSPSQ